MTTASLPRYECVATLRPRHSQSGGHIRHLAALPDGRLCSSFTNGTVKIFDRTAGCVRTLEGTLRSLVCSNPLVALPGGRVAVGNGHELKLWDISQPPRLLQTFGDHGRHINCVVALSSSRVVTGSDDHTLKCFDLVAARCLWTTFFVADVVHAGAALNNRLIAGSAKALTVLDAADGRRLQSLEGHPGIVTCVAALTNERIISGVGGLLADNTLRVWNLEDGSTQQTLAGHTAWLRDVKVLPGNRRVVSASDDRTLKIWDVSDGRCLQTLRGHTSLVLSLALLADGRIVSCHNSMIKVWVDIKTEEEKLTARQIGRQRACCDVVNNIAQYL